MRTNITKAKLGEGNVVFGQFNNAKININIRQGESGSKGKPEVD